MAIRRGRKKKKVGRRKGAIYSVVDKVQDEEKKIKATVGSRGAGQKDETGFRRG